MNMQCRWLQVFVIGIIGLGTSLSFAENWPGWRGPRGDGTSLEKDLPIQWSANNNILWKTEIPGIGHSSPIVWANSVFLASALPDKQQRLLICVDAPSGEIRWQRVVIESSLEKMHPENSYASCTPVTDGQKVYIAFLDKKDIVTAAYDFSGQQLWLSRLEGFWGKWGFASAPVLYNGRLFLNCNSQEGCFLAALSCADGRTLWKVDQASKTISFSVPLVRSMGGRMQLIHCGNNGVISYNPEDGSVLWHVDELTEEFVSTPVYHEGLGLVYIAGNHPRKDFWSIRTDGSGDVTKTHIAWTAAGIGPYVNSPVIVKDFVLGVDVRGAMHCFDAKTGKVIWSQTIGRAHASPVVAGELVYWSNDDGVTWVVRAGAEYKLAAKNELGQMCYASPAVSEGRIYIRGKTHLFCIANPLTKPTSVAHPKND